MSVDIMWETFTAGADGVVLAEKIRDFMHTRFQTVALPRFIKAVHVHSFEFGSVPPIIEIKDICDPLPDFYEDDEDDDDDDGAASGDGDDNDVDHSGDSVAQNNRHGSRGIPVAEDRDFPHHLRSPDRLSPVPEMVSRGHAPFSTNYEQPELRDRYVGPFYDRLGLHTDRTNTIDTHGNFFPRSTTPGIPGGTSNLNYFHLPVGGLSSAQTPLAAVASGTSFPPGSRGQHDLASLLRVQQRPDQTFDLQGRASASDSVPSPEIGSPFDPSSPESHPVTFPNAEKVSGDALTLESLSISSEMQQGQRAPSNPSDLQVVARVNYDGDVHMTLTAEILLDYPMPSFVGIPLKLSVTGLKFDGVAILAYIKKRMHFCFLDPEDAQTLVGDQMTDEYNANPRSKDTRSVFAGLIREVFVESEIGKREDGKQVLKNVGQVENFVLEQVRRIFEEEFVFPSFWTFLV